MEELFFNKIAGFYDDMIDFQAALERRSAVLKNFITPDMQYAADIGCGTGLDSISLYRSGLKVRSFDSSAGMLEQAQKNAEEYGAKIKFYNSGFKDIPAMFNSSFDLVVSLGNTMANIPESDIHSALSKLHDILKPEARVIIQILNYERLKKLNERIINITRSENTFFIRFYDFINDKINFNIITFNSDNLKDRTLATTPLFPYSADYLKNLLAALNFKNVELYGNLKQEEFNIDTSGDLVLSAYK